MSIDKIYAPIAGNLLKLEQQLRELLHSDAPAVSEVNNYLASGPGKRIRPALFFLTYGIWRNNSGSGLPVALAVEMIHTATLVHDDVVDNSPLRRGRPSLNAVFGNHTAVLSGDYLFALAFSLLVNFGNLPIIREMAQVVKEMSEGEIRQCAERFNPFPAEATYYKLIEQKTACFFAACSASGGIAAGASSAFTGVLKSYGKHIGMAFQIIDDLIDFYGDEPKAGRPCMDDLRNGVFTLPLIHLLNTAKTADEFRTRLAGGTIDDRLIDDVRDAMEDNGSLAYARNIAEQYVKKAIRLTEQLPACSWRDHLTRLAHFILERKN